MKRAPLLAGLLIVLVLGMITSAADFDPQKLPPATNKVVDFRQDIYPLLSTRCFKCHQGQNPKSGYRLDLRADILGETQGKPAVQLGNSEKSRLIHLVSGQLEGEIMPPGNKPLTGEEVALLRAWIDQGLKWDDNLLPATPAASDHWAFRPVKKPTVPQVKNSEWVRTPIDAFIAAQHETKGLSPAAQASPRILIRRMTFDLTGLPANFEAIEEFGKAYSSRPQAAVEQLVARLLTSPHYGERWGRHWLDLARYADSEGYESDHVRPYAWRYRDYVVESFNCDKPYHQFLREQLAGDELLPYSDDNLIATGFLAAARLSSNEEDKARQRNDTLVDIVNATSSSLLGLTLNCAQCHNHKFDPLTARDYYRFMGFFVKGQPANLTLKDRELWAQYEAALPPEYEPAKKLQAALLEKARAQLIAETRKTLTPEMIQALEIPEDQRTPKQEQLAREAEVKLQFTTGRVERSIGDEDRKLYDELKKKLEALEKKVPDKPQTFGFYSPATSPSKVDVLPMKGFYPLPYEPKELARLKPHLLIAGDIQRRGPELDVGWPALFGATAASDVEKTPRLALADWLASRTNPLTARVWVNRIWHYHFGRGLVTTTSDFGTKGSLPTHPELLDWLAAELMENDWSTRHIHRLILNSSTYQQSSAPHAGNAKIDPDNTSWWRRQPRRLEAEAMRDSLLVVSGELTRKLGGPPVPADNATRRSIYQLQRRNTLARFQAQFDVPSGTESCPHRHTTTTPLHALHLLNDPFFVERVKVFARRVQDLAGPDRERQADVGFQLAVGRNMDDKERKVVRQYFAQHAAEEQVLVHYCHLLINLNEFTYLE